MIIHGITELLGDKYLIAKEDIINLPLEDLLVLAAGSLAGARLTSGDDVTATELASVMKQAFEKQ